MTSAGSGLNVHCFEFLPKAKKRSFEVVRDVVTDLANPIHQFLDLIEHPVEIAGQTVKFVLPGAYGNTLLNVSGNNALTGLVNDLKARQHRAADEESSGKSKKQSQDDPPTESGDDAALGQLEFMNVLPHQKLKAARRFQLSGAGRVEFRVIPVAGIEIEIEPTVFSSDLGPAADVSHDRSAKRI